jgi:hypothetical protein
MKDKIIIDIEYSHSDIHLTDDQMEDMVDLYVTRILEALQDVRNDLHFNFMALATINATGIKRLSK